VAALSVERRLAAILSADVVGYSRLMGADEEGTLRALHACRAVIDHEITRHHGRVFGSAGDSVIAEFPSAVEAVRCAIAIQETVERQDGVLPEERRMRLRIGVNLGDVIVDGANLMGDGVNVAARLEAIAEPGAVYLSGTAFDHVEGKLDRPLGFVGEKRFKNIARPVRVYRVHGTPGAGARRRPVLRYAAALRGAWLLLALPVLVALGAIAWFLYVQPAMQERSFREATALPLPDKPSIAVLPFANLSGDPAQEYFADGMTEALITDLSQVSGLFVIARSSMLTYKGQPIKVQTVGLEMGVRYVLEGSVQKAADRVRITAQLIDAQTGYHLWAERFERRLDDVFALQDEVTERIVAALEVRLTETERQGLARRYTQSIEAYDAYLRGRELLSQESAHGLLQARSIFERAIALDPGFAPAYAQLAYAYARDVSGVGELREMDLSRALELAERARALDDAIPLIHFVLAYVHRQHKNHAAAIRSLERALELDPNYADAYAFLSSVLSHAGRPDEGLEMIARAKRLNPAFTYGYFQADAFAYFAQKRYDEAAEALVESLSRNPSSVLSRVYLAASYANAGRLADAEWEVAELLTLDPGLSLQHVREWAPFTHPEPLGHLLDGLRSAGLPE